MTVMRKANAAVTSAQARLALVLSSVISSLVDPRDPAALDKLAAASGATPEAISALLLGEALSEDQGVEIVSRLLAIAAPVHHEDWSRVKDLLGSLRHLRDVNTQARETYLAAGRRVAQEDRRRAEEAQRRELDAELERQQVHALTRSKKDSPPCAVPDAAGCAYKPNPLAAVTEQDFVQALRDLVMWAGNPGLREISRRCGGSPTHSSLSKLLSASTVPPKFAPVRAFILALGLKEKDIEEWMTAWRGFVMPSSGTTLIVAIEEPPWLSAIQDDPWASPKLQSTRTG